MIVDQLEEDDEWFQKASLEQEMSRAEAGLQELRAAHLHGSDCLEEGDGGGTYCTFLEREVTDELPEEYDRDED